jgi:micrococcal nuclease
MRDLFRAIVPTFVFSALFFSALFSFAYLAFPTALVAEDLKLVARVIDGDTFVLQEDQKIRLIGVDTPETVHPKKPVQYFGKEASAFLHSLLDGRKVSLSYDWYRTDKYGRTVAYVMRDDGLDVNAEILKQGYGFVYTHIPFKRLEEFRTLERTAREGGKGLWAEKAKE